MSDNKKKLLLIVDAQYDFISGSLPVKNAILCMSRLGDYIESICETNPYNTIIATVDWHPMTHCSFKENGGEWPMHCVAYSKRSIQYSVMHQAVSSFRRLWKVKA